jgi:hypothetical protein
MYLINQMNCDYHLVTTLEKKDTDYSVKSTGNYQKNTTLLVKYFSTLGE